MPVFYNENTTALEFTEPQLTRWRHRYRGPRESLKFNTEDQQFYFDVSLLYRQFQDLRESLADQLDILVNGGSIDATLFWDGVSEGAIEITGLESLISQVANLETRIRGLNE